MTASKNKIWPYLEATYGKDKASAWYYRWQIFYVACAGLSVYEGGDTGCVTLLI